MRVGLIGCGKVKLDSPAPASELYVGPFFKLCKQWISKPGRVDEWGILSAQHGLVLPDQVVDPYDLSLGDLKLAERDDWADAVHDQLAWEWGEENVVYMVLAGADYRAALRRMPMVEDVIWHWTEMRRLHGMQRPQMGIGVIKRHIINDEGFGG